ncbi:hypothetical protein TWF696_000591 [Orbilia brochopaga]|uniref:Uncharacterized protein n=1 Tax=Orbilia brochopaga TaxID=3140254 RepID=A0AAV9VBS1_9PEZI
MFSTEYGYEEPRMKIPPIEEKSKFRKLAEGYLMNELRSHPELNWQAISLDWSRKSKSWCISIFVRDDPSVCPTFTDPEGHFTIECVKGKFAFLRGICQSPLYAQAPLPGAPVGCQTKPNSSASLGGYIRGCSSGNSYAVTVGHLFFEQSQKITDKEEIRPISETATSPAEVRIRNLKEGYLQVSEDPARSDDHERSHRFIKECDLLLEDPVKTRFGMCTAARWDIVNVNRRAGYKSVRDAAFIRPVDTRIGGKNMIERFNDRDTSSIRGSCTSQDDVPVSVHVSMAKYSQGTIAGETLVRVKQFGEEKVFWMRSIKHVSGFGTHKGDSGAWVVDDKNMWVGMVIAGVCKDDGQHNDEDDDAEFTRSLFVDSEDVLTWAREMLGEEFEVLVGYS